ncbi:MAG: hypothetical protein KUG77_06775 [Nannocystaceae bacterium]|nr:hypothetical protein [Nannocystaceae bacterium]
MSFRILAPAAVAILCGCPGASQHVGAPSAPTEGPASADGELGCSFHWRESDGHEHTQTEEVELSAGTKRVTLHGFEVVVTAETTGKPKLTVETTVGEARVRSVYEVEDGSPAALRHGHGFSGLQYLTDPTGAELQYFCGATGAPADVDEVADEDDPAETVLAPNAAATSKVSCEVSVATADGTESTPEVFTLDPGQNHELSGLHPFTFSAYYQASRYEGSALIINTGDPAAAPETAPMVHTLYQFGLEPPANSLRGPSFTGLLTVMRAGARLRYRCWTEA